MTSLTESNTTKQAPFLTRLILFLKKPSWEKSYSTDWADLWVTFSWSITGAFITSILLSSLIRTTGAQPQDQSLIQELFSTQSIQTIFLSVSVLAPISEEIMFRGWLTSNKTFMGISLIASLAYMTVAFDNLFLFLLFIPVFLFAALDFARYSPIAHNKMVLYAVYYSIVIFGVLHLTNYTDLQSIWYLAPLLILSQLILGILATYVRVRHNLWLAILLHSFYNTFLFLGFTILSNPMSTQQPGLTEGITILYVSIYTLGFGTVLFNIYGMLAFRKKNRAEQLR